MQHQELKIDGSGNSYIDVANTRIQLVDRRNDPEKDWAGTALYLRFSAYKEQGGILPGAELPVSAENVLDLLRAVAALVAVVAEREELSPR